MDTTNKMGTMKMSKLLVNMSLPLMISLLVQSLYNIVDSIFVAKLSETALTATSLAYPVQLLMIAVSVGTSVGINALLSKSIGARDTEITANIAVTGVILAAAGMAVFMVLGLFFTGAYGAMYTDNIQIAEYCSDYLFICMLFCGGTFIGTMYQRFLQSVGNTFDSMITLIVGAVTNMILDPIFIFGFLFIPSMGIKGAAVATVIGQWATAFLAVFLNSLRNPVVNVKFSGYKPNKKVLLQIYRVGLPTIITQGIGSIMVTAVNAILMPFSPTAVAFFGVYYKLQNFLFMPMNGLGQAAIPIAGYNYGAEKYKRILELFKTIIPAAAGISLIGTAIFMIFPTQLLQLFSAGEEMMAMGVPALRIISVTFIFASVTMVLGYSVSGLGNGVVNMLGTGLRQLIILIPFMLIFSKFLGIGCTWYAFWPAEAVAAAYAFFAAYRDLKKKKIWGIKK